VTGHSLGGALASLCSYDLSTTVAEALAATEDPQNSKEYKALKVKDSLVG
jgi:putative lipase involved disintegration of autophagic bodies